MNKNFKQKVQNINKGITLMALIITIVVLMILATVSIQAISGEGIFEKARETKFKAEMVQLQRDLGVYVAEKQVLYRNTFNVTTLSASAYGISYETALGVETQEEDIGTIFPSISKKRKEQIEIIKGEILFSSQNKNELKWAQELGIGINPYNIVNGVLMSSETNLMLMGEDGVLSLPTSITKIADGAFSQVDGIKKVIIPRNVKEIGVNAFSHNSTLETVIIEDGVETIGQYAFKDCVKLREIMMPNSVKILGTESFENDSSLIKVQLSNQISSIGSYTFHACSSLEEIMIPEGITEITNAAFWNCTKLKTISLPNSLITLGGSVFLDCKTLNNVTIPKGVETISSSTFNRCTGLTNLTVSQENENFSAKQGMLMNKKETEIFWISSASSAIHNGTFTIPDGVTTIGGGLIESYTNITKVIIPSSVASISFGFFTKYITSIQMENNAVYQSDGKAIYSKDKTILYKYFAKEENIIIPDGVKKIEDGAFNSATASTVTAITFPDSLETTGQQIFNGCQKLQTVHLGKSFRGMSKSTWHVCGIKEVTIDPLNPNFIVDGNGIYTKDGLKLVSVYGDDIMSFHVKEGTQTIDYQAFYYRLGLQTVTMSDTVKEVGLQAFLGCSKLNNVILSSKLEKIGSGTFEKTKITTLDIPSTIKEIHVSAFQGANQLTTINIHKKKDSISGAPWSAVLGDRAIIWEE